MEANCYDCIYRGEIPGDAHSRCRHPAVKLVDDNPFAALAAVLCGQTLAAARELKIEGHPQGIRMGWFMWPASFDPVWLQNCEGFTAKEQPIKKEGV